MISKILKVIAVIDFILSFVGGIIAGKTVGDIQYLGFGAPVERGFSWQIMIILWIAGFLEGIILLALGEILSRLDVLSNNDVEIYTKLTQMNSGNDSDNKGNFAQSTNAAKATSPSFPARPKPIQPPKKNQWACIKCGTKNDESTRFCKDCGAYR